MLAFKEYYASEVPEGAEVPTATPDEQAVLSSTEGAMNKEEFAEALKESITSLESLMVSTNEMLLSEQFTPQAKAIASITRDTLVNACRAHKADLTLESATFSTAPDKVGYGTRFIHTVKNDILSLKEELTKLSA